MRKSALIATLFLTHVSLFAGGAYIAKQNTMDMFIRETEAANAEVMLGHYGIYKDIAIDIDHGNVERAKCNADLGASSMFDSVQDCLSDQRCQAKLRKTVAERAPELEGHAPIPFNYIPTKNGRKECGDKG